MAREHVYITERIYTEKDIRVGTSHPIFTDAPLALPKGCRGVLFAFETLDALRSACGEDAPYATMGIGEWPTPSEEGAGR